jgi:hypothetical protein
MSISFYSNAIQLPKGTTRQRPSKPSPGYLYFNTDKDDIEKYDPSSGWLNMTLKYYRYWRYTQVSVVNQHHPRVSRIMLVNENATPTTIVTFTSDNISDSGTIPTDGSSYTYDFGSTTPQRIIGAQIYSTYVGGVRAANIKVEYSNDNTTFYTAWTGVAHNYSTYPTDTNAVGYVVNIYGSPLA